MEYRSFDLTILSADDLKRVPLFGKMTAFAVAWVLPYERQSTPLDTNGGRRPVWNHKMSLSAPESAFQQPNARLTIEIYSPGPFGDSFVGSVFVPLADILKATQEEKLTYQVKRRSGRAKGSLDISVRLGNKTTVDSTRAYGAGSSTNPPVMAYPAGGSYGYGNQQQGAYPPPNYGIQGYPPQYPAAYPPQGYPPQYYPPVQQPVQPGRRPGFGGAGLGTGLLAGALGGLLVGDIIGSEMGGYDGGFDNSGGFDGGGFDGGFGF